MARDRYADVTLTFNSSEFNDSFSCQFIGPQAGRADLIEKRSQVVMLAMVVDVVDRACSCRHQLQESNLIENECH